MRAHPEHAAAIRDRWNELEDLRNLQETRELPMDESRPTPDRIGPYRLLGALGEGGMGTVFLAEQKEPIRRRVALKVIKAGMDSKAVLARFEVERQALALMEHPAIAKVYDAGTTPEGRPYFAMEYVKGIPITRYCDDNKLSLDERLSLFRQVCSGVQHAHTKGVIHRDLTPGNVLVTTQDGRPQVKIIDFGLARATDHKLTEKTIFTEQGMILGTPAYMSPEQAGLSGLDIDMRSDVYTLGVLLYELLTSRLPFEPAALRQAGYDGMCRTLREVDPPRPSTKITTVEGGTAAAAQLRRTSAEALLKRLRGDLDWIVLRCLEKDRTRRYETVAALSEDVQRHLDHEPVAACAPSVGYRLAKLGRRHRVALVAATLVVTALVSGLTLATYFWLDARTQARAAERQEAIARTATTQAERQRDEARRQSYVANIFASALALQSDRGQEARVRLDNCPEELRNWEWNHLNLQIETPSRELRGHDEKIEFLAFREDGARLVTACSKRLCVWDVASGRRVCTIEEALCHGVAFLGASDRICYQVGQEVVVADATTGKDLSRTYLRGATRALFGLVSGAAFNRDGSLLLCDQAMWNTADGSLVFEKDKARSGPVAFSGDGGRFACLGPESEPESVHVASTSTTATEIRIPCDLGPFPRLALNAQGSVVAGAGTEGLVVWDAGTGKVWMRDPRTYRCAAFGRPGEIVGGRGVTVAVFDVADGTETQTLHGLATDVESVAVSDGGEWIAAGAKDGTVRVWSRATHRSDLPWNAVFAPNRDGTRLVLAFVGVLAVLDLRTGDIERTIPFESSGLWGTLAWSPDDGKLVVVDRFDEIRILDVETGRVARTLRGHEDKPRLVSWSPDGEHVLATFENGDVRVWSVTGTELGYELPRRGQPIGAIAWFPDGRRFVTAGTDSSIQIWDTTRGEALRTLDAGIGAIVCVAHSPARPELAIGSADAILLLDPETGRSDRRVDVGADTLLYHPDGRRLVSCRGEVARIWEAERLTQLHELRAWPVTFTRDGRRLLTSGHLLESDAAQAQQIAIGAARRSRLSRLFALQRKGAEAWMETVERVSSASTLSAEERDAVVALVRREIPVLAAEQWRGDAYQGLSWGAARLRRACSNVTNPFLLRELVRAQYAAEDYAGALTTLDRLGALELETLGEHSHDYFGYRAMSLRRSGRVEEASTERARLNAIFEQRPFLQTVASSKQLRKDLAAAFEPR